MIRTGILGISPAAGLYAGILKQSGSFALTGCFAPESSSSKAFASKNNTTAYPSAESLFNTTDALIITDFTPDFLIHTEKAIKSFKHILITNPFLAGLDEINHLRKLSEESGVIMQIAGGFRFQNIFTDNENCLLADLKHSFRQGFTISSNPEGLEFLLSDIALVLTLLKGMPKKTNINSWECQGIKTGLISSRIELDNGCIANLLLGDLEDNDRFVLQLYKTDMVKTYESQNLVDESLTKKADTALSEVTHFEKSIRNRYLSSFHDDIMFQALELSHRIKTKSIRNSIVNYPD